MIRKGIFLVLVFCFLGCHKQQKLQASLPPTLSKNQVINTYLKEGAWNYHYLDKRFTQWIDKAIAKDSTIAYLWQQKALPLWKQHKYEEAIK